MDATQLEQRLALAHQDPAQRAALLPLLAQAKVAVLLDHGVENGVLPRHARPLVLNDRDGRPGIAAFTSVDKTRPWVEREPAFRFALHTGFDWVVAIAPAGLGIALNPGYRFDLVLSASEVDAMRHAAGAAARG
jgi:hypothetical protein